MRTKKPYNFMLTLAAKNKLKNYVFECKKNGHQNANESKIIEWLIIERLEDNYTMKKQQAKELAIKLNKLTEELRKMEVKEE